MTVEKFSIRKPSVDLTVLEVLDRRRFLQLVAVGGVSVVAGLLSKSVMSQATPGIEGYKAPELTMDYWIDGEGKRGQFSVLESKGKWVFLKCFQNWCPGCHSSGFPTLKAFSAEFFGHPKVAIAGIQTVFEGFTSNTQDAVRELQLRYDLPITMGHDPGDRETHEVPTTMRNYRTGGTPWLILINPAGVVVYNGFHVDARKLIDYVGAQIA
ncbi:MAG: thiol-disulfide isomerase/thioredoxin [Pseudomonadales bacterium]|jgi:thiol-disulfide isomerase/thioredoxin